MPAEPLLDPDRRALYGASLRPPPGMLFDAGLATTYSLDFETALAVPVTLALFCAESREELLASPLALLEGLERTAGRLVVFCEGGRIQGQARPQSRLATLLEQMIVEVAAPGGGAFHPKLWLLRCRPAEGGGPLHLRLLVLSRNLTRDRSWDLCLSLDGVRRPEPQPLNRPLVRLVNALPSLALGRLPAHVAPLAGGLADDLNHTEWTLPPGFDRLSFTINGLGGPAWMPGRCSRLGVLAPFCDDDALAALARLPRAESAHLVSRSEALAGIAPETLARFGQVSVLDALAETEDGEDTAEDAAEDAAGGADAAPLLGLHAKAFIRETGWDTAITLGSGNATRPALLDGRNVEVFATLAGRRARVGSVAEILGPEGFGRLLRSFQPGEVTETDAERRAAKARVEAARRAIARAGLGLRCARADGTASGRALWRVTLVPKEPLALDGVGALTAWQITQGEAHGRDVLAALHEGRPVELACLPLADVTRFVSFRIADAGGGVEVLFTLGLEVEGLPAERHRAVLRAVIDSRDAFLRYLRMLLADLADPFAAQLAAAAANGAGETGAWGKGADDAPLLEEMVRALAHDRERLGAVERLVERLRGEDHDRDDAAPSAIIPEEFLELWQAFRAVLAEREAAE